MVCKTYRGITGIIFKAEEEKPTDCLENGK